MTLHALPDLDASLASRVQRRLDRKTKPTGALGRLEELAVRLAVIQGDENPAFGKRFVLVVAGDHGVARKGVSAYPAEVTPQMVLNFLNGGAGVNVLAARSGAEVRVLDAGVNFHDFPSHPALISDLKVGPGTADLSEGPAMSLAQALASIFAGREAVRRLKAEGMDLLCVGEMGIGNTTPSSAIVASLLELPVREVTGRGTGLSAEGWEKKVELIEVALEKNQPDSQDAMDVLTKLGGFEIGALCGAICEAASLRIPVILDGFITGAAALLAERLEPGVKEFMIASHQSVEIGHRHLLERLGLRAYLNLDLRLGEGTGAALCLHLVDAACAVLRDMATFEDAGVSDR